MVEDNMFWKAMKLPDVVEKELGCSFHCDCYVHWNEMYSLGDGIHDSHDGIMSGGLWEFDHKIDTEHIPSCVWNRERLKLANWRMSPGFCLEAEITGTYILADIPKYLRPPVVLRHQF